MASNSHKTDKVKIESKLVLVWKNNIVPYTKIFIYPFESIIKAFEDQKDFLQKNFQSSFMLIHIFYIYLSSGAMITQNNIFILSFFSLLASKTF